MTDLPNMANAIRFLAIDSILKAGEGHQGVPLGMAEIAAVLYAKHLKYDPKSPLWPDRDRVILSNGHGSMLLYALLHLSGVSAVPITALQQFRTLGTVCAGHPEIEQHAGIEMTTGLLGQGIASAVGMAVAEARLAAEFGADLVDHRTWAFVGDGCFQEGMGQEAISLAGHLRLGKLTFLWDDNQITDDGDTALSISEDIPARFRAAGWHVVSVDGHDLDDIDAALVQAKADGRPSLLACRTRIAKGVPRLQGKRGGHSAPLTAQDRADAAQALDWDAAPFVIPDTVYADWHGAMARGADAHAAWRARHADHPKAATFDRWMSGTASPDLPATLHTLATQAVQTPRPRATILSSGDVCDGLTQSLPELMVLCADLEAPTNHKRSRTSFFSETPRGSYVHCGVREHLMGAMCNGIAAHGGLRPVNVTYLAFADYQRAAMRMAALMGLPVTYVFSHDSIGTGSNGPTHQPVEILSSFRAMPNMRVFRPADAVETAEAWALALDGRNGPSMLALSRQDTPALRDDASENLSARGAYRLAGPEQPDLTLLATGTEVAIAMQARALLAAQGVQAAVISMPCWELFAEQPHSYRTALLGTAPRIGVEAAMKFGWERWLRESDGFVGMTGFGASATAPVLYDHFGITPEQVAALGQSLL